MQLLDEIPMIWTASILLYASLSRSITHSTHFAVGLTVTIISLTIFYLTVANPEILFLSFGILLVVVLIVNLLKKTTISSDDEIVSKDEMDWNSIASLWFCLLDAR